MSLSESWTNRTVLKGLYEDPRFKHLYQYVRISLNSSNTREAIMGFVHREYLSYILNNPGYKVEFVE